MAAGHRVVGVRNADAFTLSYIFEDSTFGLKSVPATISLADSFLIRAGFNDVKIVKVSLDHYAFISLPFSCNINIRPTSSLNFKLVIF